MAANTIACISIAGAGLLTAIISFIFFISVRKRKKLCSAQTTGTVIDYNIKYRTNSAGPTITPIVEFTANGKSYKARRHYKYSAVSSNSANPKNKHNELYISENDVFHLKLYGKTHDLKALAEKQWPLGTSMTVIYNPQKPEQAYAEKFVSKCTIAGTVLLCCGIGMIIIAGLAYIIF
ncbi:MAG: DUF3592 domain-containing protein [Oscillospiraceae bacterium]|nr:DUF3592 domain-containing protein [Oscillospiraceae bacterium]